LQYRNHKMGLVLGVLLEDDVADERDKPNLGILLQLQMLRSAT